MIQQIIAVAGIYNMIITGNYVSIDLDTKKLKIYYGEKSYNKAYYV